MAVRIFEDGIPEIKLKRKIIKGWVREEILRRKQKPGDMNIVLATDAFVKQLNKAHLDRDYFTDVITFDYSEHGVISGDVFISIDRVKENAGIYRVDFRMELYRVIIHGVLHMLGFRDDDRLEKSRMTRAEDEAIKRLMTVLEA